MRRAIILGIILTASSCVFAQESGNAVFFQGQAAGPVTTIGVGMVGRAFGAQVQGAPYSATITNENNQTLEDGTHIAQTSTGNIARDSQGRTRQDASLPPIGNLSAADAPHIVFIQDPVAQTAYTLNMTEKTAMKMPGLPANISASGPAGGPGKVLMQMGTALPAGGPPPPGMAVALSMQKTFISGDQGQSN